MSGEASSHMAVMAETLENAVERIRRDYPGCLIYAVNLAG